MFHLLWEVSLHSALSWPCRACGALPEPSLPTVLFQCSPLILHSPTQRREQPADSLSLALSVFTLCNYLVIHRIIPHCQRHVSLATDSLFREKNPKKFQLCCNAEQWQQNRIWPPPKCSGNREGFWDYSVLEAAFHRADKNRSSDQNILISN